MIPTIEQICNDLMAGTISLQDAIKWLKEHARLQELEQMNEHKLGSETANSFIKPCSDCMVIDREWRCTMNCSGPTPRPYMT